MPNSSPLFHDDFPVKLENNVLVKELESMMPENDMIFNKILGGNKLLTVDFMSIIRQLPLRSDNSFNDTFDSALGIIKSICEFHQLHVVYYSYVLGHLREFEHNRLNLVQPLNLYGAELPLKIPVQTGRFWASNFNKKEIQKLSREYLKNVVKNEQMVICT